MITREYIISEIKRLAEKSGGRAPGKRRFQTATGIGHSQWDPKFWISWGDALAEAGYEPNKLYQRFDDDTLFSHFARAVRHFKRTPSAQHLQIYKRDVEPSCPNHSAFTKHERQAEMIARFVVWIGNNPEYSDVLSLLTPLKRRTSREDFRAAQGFVYLIKYRESFKVGRSNEIDRRIKEIRQTLPKGATMVHVIRTDDPKGIQDYWNRRFAVKRGDDKWFKLTAEQVSAFKGRRMM